MPHPLAGAVPINFHLALHGAEDLRNFGPTHAFSCYVYERFNGILHKFKTSVNGVERQIMLKMVLQDILMNDGPWHESLSDIRSTEGLRESPALAVDRESEGIPVPSVLSHEQAALHIGEDAFGGVLDQPLPRAKRAVRDSMLKADEKLVCKLMDGAGVQEVCYVRKHYG